MGGFIWRWKQICFLNHEDSYPILWNSNEENYFCKLALDFVDKMYYNIFVGKVCHYLPKTSNR